MSCLSPSAGFYQGPRHRTGVHPLGRLLGTHVWAQPVLEQIHPVGLFPVANMNCAKSLGLAVQLGPARYQDELPSANRQPASLT